MFDEHLTHLDAEAVRNYLHGGRTPAVGAPLAQPNLAATFRRIGREGIQAVYGGALGEGIVKALGGIMTRADLEAYPERLRWDDPLTTTYRDVEVFAPAPPSSGSQVLETLNGMGGWNLGAIEHLGPDHLSIIAEASRAARVDTHRHIGDPDVVPVPVERLLGAARTEALRAEMRARLEAPRRPVAVAGGSGGDARRVHDAPGGDGLERPRGQRHPESRQRLRERDRRPRHRDLPQQRAPLDQHRAGPPERRASPASATSGRWRRSSCSAAASSGERSARRAATASW